MSAPILRADGSSWTRVLDALGHHVVKVDHARRHADARCPAHDDRNPSLSVDWREDTAKGGRVLIRCHGSGGCDVRDILAAVELVLADLYDTPPARPDGPPSPRAARPAPARRTPKPVQKNTGTGDQVSTGTSVPAVVEEVARYDYPDADGTPVMQVRRFLRSDGSRTFGTYRWQAGRWVKGAPQVSRPLYNLPAVVAAIAAGEPVHLVEGEKDADAVNATGAVATTAAGGAVIDHTGQLKRHWREEHTAALVGAHLIIWADRDGADPKHPERGYLGYGHAHRLRELLTPAAATIRIVAAAEGKDADDHLTAGHPLDDAVEIEPTDHVPAEVLTRWGVAAPEVEPAGDAGVQHEDEGQADEHAADVDQPGDPAADNVLSLPARHQVDDGQVHEHDGTFEFVRERFVVYEGSLCKVEHKPGGPRSKPRTTYIELLPARVRLLRQVVRDMDDGAADAATHVDLEVDRYGHAVELTRIEYESFRSMAFMASLPWPLPFKDTPAGRSTLRNAIVSTSGAVPVVIAYGTLGWREVQPGRWAFVHAKGAIGARGTVASVRVEISPRLTPFALPDPPASERELGKALDGVLATLDAFPARVTAPVLGAVFRALLGECPTSVYLTGNSGTRKSGIAALAQQFYCPTAHHKRLPVGAGEDAATVNALEQLRYEAAHTLLVVDDLAPDRSAERSAARAAGLLRSQGNSTSKARMNRKGGLQPDRPPRSLIMLTAEDTPTVASAETRTVYVVLRTGDVPLSKIKALSTKKNVAARTLLTAALAQYVAPRWPIEERRTELHEQYSEALTEDENDGWDSRRADSVAEFAVGWRVLLDMAVDRGVWTVEQATEVWQRVWAGLVEVKRLQGDVTARRSLPERAADLLRAAVRSGRAHFEDPKGGRPDDFVRFGWTAMGDGLNAESKPKGNPAGWTDGTWLWMDPAAAFAMIEAQGRASGDPLNVTQRTLASALLEAGVVTPDAPARSGGAPRTSVRRDVGGTRQRVWETPVSWLYPDDQEDGDNPQPAESPAPSPQPPTLPAGPTSSEGEPAARDAAAGTPEPAAETPAEQPEAPAASDGSAQDQENPVQASQRPYDAAALVVDADCAYLVGGEDHRDPLVVPAEVDSVAGLLDWVETEVRLGTKHKGSRDDAGQVWVMPDLARRIGLPKTSPKRPDKGDTNPVARRHPVVKALREAGWEVGNRGLQAWTTAWRPGQASVHLVVPGWLQEDGILDARELPTAAEVAYRLYLFGSLVGMPYLYGASTTGTSLLKLSRVTATDRTKLTLVTAPPPAKLHRMEPEWSWQRAATQEELEQCRWVHAYDCNAQYLAAAALVNLGIGDPVRVENPTVGNLRKLPAGYWLVDHPGLPDKLPAGMPDLLDPMAGEATAKGLWITTPTLQAALQAGYKLRPRDAWLWEDWTTWLEGWSNRLRDARYELERELEAGDDPNTFAVLRAVKMTYAGGIGMLASEEWRGGTPEYRPDGQHQVKALAKANLWRKCRKAAAAGRVPLALHRDTVLFAANTPDPALALPDGFRLHAWELGAVKHTGVAELTTIADQLAKGSRPTPAMLELVLNASENAPGKE